MKILKKIFNAPLWLVTLVVALIVYIIDNNYYNQMCERWSMSDATDTEAYKYINHHSPEITIFYYTLAIVAVFWIVRKIINRRKKKKR